MQFSKYSTLTLTVFLMAACSTLARLDEVSVDSEDIALTNHHAGAVLVKVRGGNPNYVSNEIFTEALVQSLNNLKVFNRVSTSEPGDYELRVVIDKTGKAGAMGGKAWTRSSWELRGVDGTTVWSKKIEGVGKSMEFGGVKRTQEAAERSGKDTIKIGIEHLSSLELGPEKIS